MPPVNLAHSSSCQSEWSEVCRVLTDDRTDITDDSGFTGIGGGEMFGRLEVPKRGLVPDY